MAFVGAFVVGAVIAAVAAASVAGAADVSLVAFLMKFVVAAVVILAFGGVHHEPFVGSDSSVVFLAHGSSLAWLSKWERVEGAASSFTAELAREIVHGRSFRALAFASHVENGREVFWKRGRVVGVAQGDSSAGWCAQA